MVKVHKGLHECCKHPGYTSSIPTTYQTVVISNEEKKGFSSQTKRFFSEDSLNANPGPATYMSHTPADLTSPSYSKKGTGGFASQAVRVPLPPQRGAPAPNAYNLQASLLHTHSHGRAGSRVFRPPVAVQHGPKHTSPAPNQYNVCFGGVERNAAAHAQCVFLSKTGRSSLCTNTVPSPCHYKVKDAVVQRCPRVPLSCFKSSTARIQSPVDRQVPGPGSYSPYQPPGPGSYSPYQPPGPAQRTTLLRRHYLGLAAPPLVLPETPPPPGPGQYELVDYAGPSKRLVSQAAFVSGTSRWARGAGRGQGGPGPGFYEPEMACRRSFLSNHARKWIPA